MSLKKVTKILGIVLLIIVVQAYFLSTANFLGIISKWSGYFTSIIMALFLAVLLNPIAEFFRRKIKMNLICSLIASILIVILIILVLLMIIIPQILASMK